MPKAVMTCMNYTGQDKGSTKAGPVNPQSAHLLFPELQNDDCIFSCLPFYFFRFCDP